jgi:hypothetical protein
VNRAVCCQSEVSGSSSDTAPACQIRGRSEAWLRGSDGARLRLCARRVSASGLRELGRPPPYRSSTTGLAPPAGSGPPRDDSPTPGRSTISCPRHAQRSERPSRAWSANGRRLLARRGCSSAAQP